MSFCWTTGLLIWTLLKTVSPEEEDTAVLCVFNESCILPCSFQSNSEEVIHWFKVAAGDLHVHSFYNNQDQLEHQDQNFRNRTSLFRDQISRGNASLLLTGVKVQDEGRYRCFISIILQNNESFINLTVDAPVSKVHITQVDNRMTCSSEGIYPEPELTWSTIPPSSWTLQSRTTVHQTEDQLYSISSSLVVSDGGSDLIYSCTIRTHRNWRRTSLRKLTPIRVSSRLVTLPCSAANYSITFSLIWRFNLSQVIMNQTRTNVTVSEEWRKHVKEVSESGSLTLQDLSIKHQGTYTCEVSDGEETNITNILLRVEEGGQANVAGIASGVLVSLLLSAALSSAFLWFYKKRREQQESSIETRSGESAEALPTAH